jgi:hypothetical protein
MQLGDFFRPSSRIFSSHIAVDRSGLGLTIFGDPTIDVDQAFSKINPTALKGKQFARSHTEVVRDDKNGLHMIA